VSVTTFVMIAVVASLIGAYDFVRRARARYGIAPASELQKRFGLYAENRPIIQLDPALVPPDLHHLIPLAEKWGIGDDIIRNDFIDKSSRAEMRELHDGLAEPASARITEWINSFADTPLSDEAAAFMYMEIARDEMGFYLDEGTAPPGDLS
jgi:hypothetical protein